jgi:hypothetical protein
VPSALIFPIVGVLIVIFGVLTAVFNERSARIQKRYDENFTLFGRWTSKWVTPGFMRVCGILLATFGMVYLTLGLVTLFSSLRS